MVLPYLAVKIDKTPGRHAQRTMYRSFDRLAGNIRCCIGGPRIIERGPPGTRRAPSASITTPFGVSVRTQSAYLLRTTAQKGLRERAQCPKNIFTRRRISAVAKRPCLRTDRTGRSIVRSIFKGRLIQLRHNLAGEQDRYKSKRGECKMRIEIDGRADVKHLKIL